MNALQRRTILPLTILALALACAQLKAAATIDVDASDTGRTFDGVGGLSAGASSRLLIDYPPKERDQILDYLFKPNYGAASHVLKVEIGGDTNSTSGAEPSHMRQREGDLNGQRGYEWWLMHEAKKRNPDIKLWALEWGAPGWFKGGFWSQDNVDYIMRFLDLAKKQGLTIDYVGGWNESGHDAKWYVALKKALLEKHPETKIVADDAIRNKWSIIDDMAKDKAFYDAVDIVGVHDTCTVRTEYLHSDTPQKATDCGKKIWDSEQSSQGHDVGGIPLARAMNRHYIEGKITGNVNWSLISAWYASLPLADTGWMLADRPWSGYYHVGRSIWTNAHTDQFTRIGWQYLDKACGYTTGGASHVAFKSPDGKDLTVVIEAMDVKSPEPITLKVNGFGSAPLHLWTTDFSTSDESKYFVHEKDVAPSNGSYSITLAPKHLYTLTTTTGQAKGDAKPEANPADQMALPYQEDFEQGEASHLARFWSDLSGAFEIAPATGGRQGKVYRQVTTIEPIAWGHRQKLQPTSVFGDPRWWGDYEFTSDVMIEQKGHVELLGRVSYQHGLTVAGYHLRLGDNGEWKLYSQEFGRDDVDLGSGKVDFAPGAWHRLGLRFKGNEIAILFDDKAVSTINDDKHLTGQVGIATSAWDHAQFDNMKIVKAADWPKFIPHSQMTATATSDHPANERGYTYAAANAIDDRPETGWSVEWKPRPRGTQSITLDLGKEQQTSGIAYQPRYNGPPRAMIANFRVLGSADGQKFDEIAKGEWAHTTSTKFTTWPPRSARYIRLEALSSPNRAAATTNPMDGAPSAAEINIAMP